MAAKVGTGTTMEALLGFLEGNGAGLGSVPAVGQITPDYMCLDGSVPRGRLVEVLGEMRRMSKTHRLRVVNVFHAGDGNLHPLILFDANDPDELRHRIRSEVIDQTLRLRIARETEPVRNLIFALAFSQTGLADAEDQPG